MDRYGRRARTRLAAIEGIFNKWFIKDDWAYAEMAEGRVKVHKQMGHYREFYGPAPGEKTEYDNVSPQYHVRNAICIFGALVTTLCISLLGWYVSWMVGWTVGESIGWSTDIRTFVLGWAVVGTPFVLAIVWQMILDHINRSAWGRHHSPKFADTGFSEVVRRESFEYHSSA